MGKSPLAAVLEPIEREVWVLDQNYVDQDKKTATMKVPKHRGQWTCACRDHGSVYIRLNEYRIADFQNQEVRKLPLLS